MKEQILQLFHNIIGKETKPQEDMESRAVNQASHRGKADVRGGQDALVNLTNQQAFTRLMEEQLRKGQAKGCLLVADVDRFKDINQIYGYDVGNAVLSSIAGMFLDVFDGSGYLGRMNGDKFALWLTGLPKNDTEYVFRQIGMMNDRLLHPSGELPPVSLSVGAAFCEEGDDYRSLGKKANKTLYRVKEGGRCGCEIYDE